MARNAQYARKVMAWQKANPDKPLPWSYFDTEGMEVHVMELPLNHPARHVF